ncbi:hypothetical protein PUN4_320079 [Paraburkholderia unamae]|nr:hypothetical protein PUN4_320079 [Paraburkholderia unamae]
MSTYEMKRPSLLDDSMPLAFYGLPCRRPQSGRAVFLCLNVISNVMKRAMTCCDPARVRRTFSNGRI